MKIDHVVLRVVQALRQGNLAVFAGAGLSMPAGYVDWKGLLRPLASELGIDVDRETDLVSVAQFYYNSKGQNRTRLSQRIIDELGTSSVPTNNHEILARLPIGKYWTTNYDSLIERALERAGKIADVKHDAGQIATTRANRDSIVYKMHGDASLPQKAVLIKDDYERYTEERGPFVTALSGDLVEQTFLFMGFSFTDPNIDYILSRVRLRLQGNQREHYAIFRERSKDDGESEEDFSHFKARQELVIADLRRFNIQVVLVKEYFEITRFLERVESLFRAPRWFLSASCSDFKPWGEVEVSSFMRKLGTILIDNGIHIHCGLGLGIGNALLTGALEQIYRSNEPRVEKHLTLRPFPQFIDDDAKRAELWTAYRRQLVSGCGYAIFIFGNKVQDQTTLVANGMIEEFEICLQSGVVPLPIGATGWASKEIVGRLRELPEWQSMPTSIKSAIEGLQCEVESLESLLHPITELIKLIER